MSSWRFNHLRDSAEAVHGRELPAERAIWQASISESAVVLGSKQNLEIVNQQSCQQDGISVVHRRSGGGVVVLQADAHFVAVLQAGYAIAAHEVQQLFGKASAEWQGVEVFNKPVELADTAGMQAEHGLIKLDMACQYLLEIRFGDAEYGAVSMGIGIMGAAVAIKNSNITKPDAWLYVGERYLLSGNRGGADPHCAFGACDPLFGRLTARCDQIPIAVALYIGTPQNIMLERRREARKPPACIDGRSFFDCKNGFVHKVS